MLGTCKQGFSLVEVLVVLALIAVVGTVVVPTIWRTDPRQARHAVLGELNALIGLVQQRAVTTGKEHKIECDFKQGVITASHDSGKRTSEGKSIFEPLSGLVVKPEIAWPRHLQVKQFVVEGFDEMTRFAGAATTRIWFFVLPDGMTQAVTINLIDTKDIVRGGKGRQCGWVLNPFSAQFKEYDAFQE